MGLGMRRLVRIVVAPSRRPRAEERPHDPDPAAARPVPHHVVRTWQAPVAEWLGDAFGPWRPATLPFLVIGETLAWPDAGLGLTPALAPINLIHGLALSGGEGPIPGETTHREAQRAPARGHPPREGPRARCGRRPLVGRAVARGELTDTGRAAPGTDAVTPPRQIPAMTDPRTPARGVRR
jgi:hypothetical protein